MESISDITQCIFQIEGVDTTVYGRQKNVKYRLKLDDGRISSPDNDMKIDGEYNQDNTFEYTVHENKLHNGLTVHYKGKINTAKMEMSGAYSWYFFSGSFAYKIKYELQSQDIKRNDESFSILQQSQQEIKDEMYSKLLCLGFSHESSIKAALLFPNDINEAITAALGKPEELIDDNKSEQKAENIYFTTQQSIQHQFYNFLERISMQKYFNKFKDNEVCDMESVQIFAEFTDNDIKNDETLRDIIGIKNVMLRKKFVRHCQKIKREMDEFENKYGISSVLHENLAKYGIVTINILCNEVSHKYDLKKKFKIINEHQIDKLWSIINNEMSEYNEEGLQIVHNDNQTVYI